MTDLMRDVLERRRIMRFYAEMEERYEADLEHDRAVERILRRWPATGPRGFTALVNWLIWRRWPGER